MEMKKSAPRIPERKFEKTDKPVQDAAYMRRRRIVSILSLVIALAFFAVIAVVIGRPLIAFIEDAEQFRLWVDAHGVWGRLAFFGIRVVQTIITILPGEAVEIGAGYAFGAWEGLLWCTLGSAAGSAVIYAITKRFGVHIVEAFITREKLYSFRFVRESKRLNTLMFLFYLMPGTPKDVMMYFVGLTPMKLSTFLLITSAARIPSIITSTLGGDAIGIGNYSLAAVVLAVTAAVSLIGLIAYWWYFKKLEEKEKHTPETER